MVKEQKICLGMTGKDGVMDELLFAASYDVDVVMDELLLAASYDVKIQILDTKYTVQMTLELEEEMEAAGNVQMKMKKVAQKLDE